jgi:hypothetical protein
MGMDTMAAGIVSNRRFLEATCGGDRSISMGGINANGARISTLNDGRFRVRAVYYSSEASVNVLCMSDIVDRAIGHLRRHTF